ncbi:MAG: putative DNA binding domain-containing protein [Bacteroides sp.]|nr:putative DNA binding domain-containing protein [Ruminococcus flavefaciens]MCM1553983.1 putative DNA binding domain-containing protein [Bacteroides sp.]
MEIDNLDTIQRLIANKENEQVEFKETTGQLERGMETLCAFLNDSGGTVLFGINDKGKITGQEVADNTKRNIADAINRLEPRADVQVSYTALPNSSKMVVALHVENARYSRPFCYKGRPYQRIESVTSTMPQTLYHQLLMQHGGKNSWESIINPELGLDDLDNNAIMGAVRAGIRSGRLPETTIREEIPVILDKFDLRHQGMLNNAAAVLFGHRFYNYPQCVLRLARFKGTTKDEFFDNQRVQGNIYALLDAAMTFFFKHLSLSGKIEGLYREEELSIPYKALRECCINAFCHRAYHRPGSSVGIAIYDDRVEIENSGTFSQHVDIEKIKVEHRSDPHNPIIANVLYRSDVLENWGRGISLMINECLRVGLPEPEFHTDGNFSWVIFRYTRKVAGYSADGGDSLKCAESTFEYRTSSKQIPTSTRQVPDKYPTSTRQVLFLIETIGLQQLSVKEMMDLLRLKDRENFLNNYLTPAQQAGLVAPLYPQTPNHPKQKYLLTEKGRLLLQK